MKIINKKILFTLSFYFSTSLFAMDTKEHNPNAVAEVDLQKLEEEYTCKLEEAYQTIRESYSDKEEACRHKNNFEQFVNRFSPPKSALRELLSHQSLGSDAENIPGLYLKGFLRWNFSRLINVERMRILIENHNFQHLRVPKKYIFFGNFGWKLFAERIETTARPKKINVEQTKELFSFRQMTGYSDYSGENIIQDTEGKLTFVDNEDNSFDDKDELQDLENLKYYYSRQLEPSALHWFNEQLEHLMPIDHDEHNPTGRNFLPMMTDLDDETINLEDVRTQLRKFRCQFFVE